VCETNRKFAVEKTGYLYVDVVGQRERVQHLDLGAEMLACI
jgi:hypothetical protein